ncbi:MAG TPA: heavy metal translocating P-type ATPase, partial [Chlamydiales bacterium]|nr:heavy metal translocating P-type ATPase [Chlamydiales bacterium]
SGILATSGGPKVPHVAIIFYILAIILGGYFVVPKAIAAARVLKPDMNVLMVVAVLGASSIGEWAEAATVTFLFSVALFLEHWSLGRAKKAIGALMELSPDQAHVIEETGIVTKHVDDVAMGQRIAIRPGDKIPLDGRVIKGTSTVNQAPITGESMPVNKAVNDVVFAGTLNEDGALEVEVTKNSKDSTLSRMIELVREASLKRAKTEAWVEKFAKIYTPIMIGLAIVFILIPPLFFGGHWTEWIYRGLVILVIGCPCALVISTPVSIVAGLTAAAKEGVLIKGGVYLETAGHLKALAFDKTGTLTYGRPTVQKIIPLNGHSENDLLSIAASLESVSAHPLAKAITKKAQDAGVEIKRPDELTVIQGKGAEALLEGESYWIGSHRFLHEKKLETPEMHAQAVELEDEGHSIVVIGTNKHVCGLISVADEPRENIADILRELKKIGIAQTIMLTGDNQPTAKALAKHAGIDRYFAELLPEDKVRTMRQMVQRWGFAGMVGDGVNDAPAMASSSLGIAMGGAGSDSAIETADIALMADDLSKLPWLIGHSRKTLKTIKSNIGFALGIKLLFLGLAVFGLASLWMAIAADTGASLLVVAYGLRLIRP